MPIHQPSRVLLLIQSTSASIEVLPIGFDIPPVNEEDAPFLFIDGNLGVPQKALYKAYMIAIQIFSASQHHRHDPNALTDHRALRDSTAIILLANPGHTTALNTRKLLVSARVWGVRDELAFTRALLSVQQTAKSSILWHHRRWLLELHPEMGWPSPTSVRNELEIAAQACEVYPRNYYAWLHKMLAVDAMFHKAGLDAEREQLLLDEVRATRKWIETHIKDHSAVHYMLQLLRTCQRLKVKVPPLEEDDETLGLPVHAAESTGIKHAAGLVKAYPDREALWLYLRELVRPDESLQEPGWTHDQRVQFIQALKLPHSIPGAVASPDNQITNAPTHAQRFLERGSSLQTPQ